VEKLLTIFKVPELRRKILFTAALLAIYRIGFYVPLPIVNQQQLSSWEEQQSGNTAGKLFGTVAMFGGTSIGMSTIFGLGIMPYISASIIFQLLASVVPSLEAMMKEGESGRKRINEYTRYATVALCAVQSAFWVQYMMSPQMNVVLPAYRDFWHGFVCVCIMTAGTIFLMWIGEQIDEYGIGNGISLLIMAGILARLPVAITGPNGLWYNSTSKLTPEPGKYGRSSPRSSSAAWRGPPPVCGPRPGPLRPGATCGGPSVQSLPGCFRKLPMRFSGKVIFIRSATSS
jgi:preprotein translocase subunit SecY